MAAGSTRHIEPLLPSEQGAAAPRTGVVPLGLRRFGPMGSPVWAPHPVYPNIEAVAAPETRPLFHQVSAPVEDPRFREQFQVVRWGGPAGLLSDDTRIVPHQVVKPAATPLPPADFFQTDIGRTPPVDTTRVVPHQVIRAAATPLPQADFGAWQPPPFVETRLWPHQVCLPPQDPRRYQRFTVFQSGIGYTPPVDTTRIVPHQVVDPVEDPRRQAQFRFVQTAPPPFVQPTRLVPFQVVPVPADRRGWFQYVVVRHGGPAGTLTDEVITTRRFGPPSPTSGAGIGTPDASLYPGSPSSGAGVGTPDADRYGPPSPERVRV